MNKKLQRNRANKNRTHKIQGKRQMINIRKTKQILKKRKAAETVPMEFKRIIHLRIIIVS